MPNKQPQPTTHALLQLAKPSSKFNATPQQAWEPQAFRRFSRVEGLRVDKHLGMKVIKKLANINTDINSSNSNDNNDGLSEKQPGYHVRLAYGGCFKLQGAPAPA